MTNTIENQRSAAADLGRALLTAFGLPATTTKLTIRLDAASAPVIETEYFPEAKALEDAASAVEALAGRLRAAQPAECRDGVGRPVGDGEGGEAVAIKRALARTAESAPAPQSSCRELRPSHSQFAG